MFSFLITKTCVIHFLYYIHASPAGTDTKIVFSFLEDKSKQNKKEAPAFDVSILYIG